MAVYPAILASGIMISGQNGAIDQALAPINEPPAITRSVQVSKQPILQSTVVERQGQNLVLPSNQSTFPYGKYDVSYSFGSNPNF